MPSDKPIAKYLGIGRGSFRKAFLSVLLSEYSDEKTYETAVKELGNNCAYCGISSKKVKLQPDFLWPQADGGLYKLGNVVPACPTCNSTRGNKDWYKYMRSLSGKLTSKAIQEKISKIESYMKKHHMLEKPDIDKIIKAKDRTIQKDLDILLDALTQGLRAKINMPQTKDVKFRNPDLLFDELVAISKKYLIQK